MNDYSSCRIKNLRRGLHKGGPMSRKNRRRSVRFLEFAKVGSMRWIWRSGMLSSARLKAEAFWKSGLAGILLILIFLTIAGYLHYYIPSPGKAVAALAIAAAIMTLRQDMSGLEKFFWMGVLFVFLFIEVRSIDKDRAANDEKFFQASQKQDQSFAVVLKQNQTDFNETISRLDTARRSMDSISGTTQRTLSDISGGHSFCYIEMRTCGGGLPERTAVVALLGKGKDPLSSVDIRIADIDEMYRRMAAKMPMSSESDRHFYFQERIRYTGLFRQLYTFKPEQETKTFNVFLRALNGIFTERLRLRYVNKTWLNAIRVEVSYYDKTMGLALEQVD